MTVNDFNLCQGWFQQIKEKVYESLTPETITEINSRFVNKIDLRYLTSFLRSTYKNDKKEKFKNVSEYLRDGGGDCEDQAIFYIVMLRLGKVRRMPPLLLSKLDVAFLQYDNPNKWHVGFVENVRIGKKVGHVPAFFDFLPWGMEHGRLRFCFPVEQIFK